MSKRYLNLRDATAIVDTMEAIIEFLPEKDRSSYEKTIIAVREGNPPPSERLAEIAKNIGAITWPARQAFGHFLQGIGSELEWEAVCAAVRPTTRLLLQKIRESVDAQNLDQVLASDDAGYLIHPEQDMEVRMAREEVRLTLWEEHGDQLKPMIQEAYIELEAIKKRLKSLRDQAMSMKSAQQDSLLRKIESFEDRIYFGGEAIPLEVLEMELKFDIEDAVLPPSDTTLAE